MKTTKEIKQILSSIFFQASKIDIDKATNEIVNIKICEHPYHLVDVRLDGKVKWCYNCNCEF